MWGTISSVVSAVGEAAAGMVLSGVASPFISRYQMHEDLDLTLCILQQELMKLNAAFVEARERRITNPKLLEWWAEIISDSYRGNYYYRTFKHHRSSCPLMIESEDTNSPTNRAAKKRRIIRYLLFGDEEMKNLYDVLKRLQNIDMRTFLQMVYAQPKRPMKKYLYMDQNILLNRDKEIQQVMDFLFEPSKAGKNNVDILPIVGSVGAGKTSLAVRCFYDPKCNNTYIIKSDDVNTLLVILKQNLSSEKFLFVLDDRVVKMNSVLWSALLDCLRCGKQGSKVIFVDNTFDYERHNKKIINPEAVMPVMVDGFSEDEYLFFFKEHAFGGANPEDYPELAKIGVEIAKKMNGSIWGAKIFGELLRDNLNAPFWSNFLEGGFLSRVAESSGIYGVIDTVDLLLPKKLQLIGMRVDHHRRPEVKTFRELMIFGPNHLAPDPLYVTTFWVLVGEYVFLNEYKAFIAVASFCSGDEQDSTAS